MIPLRLCITGFLSYGQKAELDFTSFDLACISGANGAGKSSLLKAIIGLLPSRRGEIYIDGRPTLGQPGLSNRAVVYFSSRLTSMSVTPDT